MTLDFGTYRPRNGAARRARQAFTGLARLALALTVLALVASEGAAAEPLPCDVVTASECQITTLHDLGAGGAFTVDRALHVFGPSGELRTGPGGALTLDIAGGLVVDVGGRITGIANTAAGRGATIDITAAGTVLLAGNGSSGAVISVNQTVGSCQGGRAGNISLTSTFQSVDPSITVEHGASITANARCSAGAIAIAAPNGAVDIRGLVESASALTGTGAKQAPGGGPISISASCRLLINDTGRVSSRGADPGADLVHLEAGGDINVIGLVESTGPGHNPPDNPANSCAGAKRPGKPQNSTACVELWAGGSIVIDGSGTNRGEINADTGQGGGHEVAWIDLLAKGDITITGAGAGPYAPADQGYAVHANQFVSTSTGGIITVKSEAGRVTLGGQAIQADGGVGKSDGLPSRGGQGGVIAIEAGGPGSPGGDVDLGTASVRARGANSGGGAQAGGDIRVVSFNGRVVGAAPGEVNASGGGAKNPGTVQFQGCGTTPVSYTGASTPVPGEAASCGGVPEIPVYVVFPTAACTPPPPCLPPDCPPPPCEGPDCPCEGPDCPCVGPDCPCVGPDCPCVGPDCPCVGPACPCEGPDCPPPPCTGPDCPPSFCAKGTVEAVMNPATGRFPGNRGPDVLVDLRKHSLQAALDGVTDKNGDGYIIVGVVARDNRAPGGEAKTEVQVTRAYKKPFALIGCGVTLVDRMRCNGKPPVTVQAGATSPEFPAGSGVTLYFQEITAKGSDSSPGWNVAGNGRFFEAVGAQSNMQGMKVVGHDNTIRHSFARGSLAGGVVVQGNRNTIDTVEARNNAAGDGIEVIGNRNTVTQSTAGGQGAGNGGAGITVRGAGNLVSKNKAFGNDGDGIHVSGGTAAAPNIIRSNVAGAPYRGNVGSGIVVEGAGKGPAAPVDIDANTAQSNGIDGFKVTQGGHRLRNNVAGGAGAANVACQYDVAPGNFNATGNKRGSTVIPGANSTPFPSACK
jgi:hypothetical protein